MLTRRGDLPPSPPSKPGQAEGDGKSGRTRDTAGHVAAT